MDVLATREIQYTDDNGEERNVVLTIYAPHTRVDNRGWRGAFAFGPPIERLDGTTIPSGGIDFIQCFLGAVEVAYGYLLGSKLRKLAHWQGVQHCGLPWRSEKPEGHQEPQIPPLEERPGNLEVLGTRKLAFPDQNGVTSKVVLIVSKPTPMGDGTWKCAYSFDPLDGTSIRFGTGVDYMESILETLALARVTYDSMIPHGWQPSKTVELLDCDDLPYKSGRAYFIDPIASRS
ncbi:MAG TPA: hypothetical protein PK156_28640 [Polyangium sp.]|nr:hypothetical protein [Polyangium sp.]